MRDSSGWDSSPIYRVSPNGRFGGRGSPYMVGATSKIKGGDTFMVRLGIQGV